MMMMVIKLREVCLILLKLHKIQHYYKLNLWELFLVFVIAGLTEIHFD